MPRASIVICAFNAEGTLEAALQSAVTQTIENIEIIVVDDASTDGTPSIINRFAEQDSRIRIVTHDVNRQLLEARRTGLHAAKAPYVIYLDSDDTIRPHAIEALLDAVSREPNKLTMAHASSFPILDEEATEDVRTAVIQYLRAYDGVLEGDEITHAAFRDYLVSWNMWGKLFDRRILERAYDEIPESRVFQFED